MESDKRLCVYVTEKYNCEIYRDYSGNHYLLVNGKEMFAKKTDDGKPNKKKQRVKNILLLYDVIESLKQYK